MLNKIKSFMNENTVWIILFIFILILIISFIPGKLEPLTIPTNLSNVPSSNKVSTRPIPTKLTSASFTPSTSNKYKSVSNYNQDILSTHGAFNSPIIDNRNLNITRQLPSMNKSWGYNGPIGSSISTNTSKPYQDYASMITYTSNLSNKGTCSYSVYGCCPDNTTAKVDASGSNCQLCSDGITYYTDASGSNCPVSYGLCSDDMTPKIDSSGSNCPMCSDGITYYMDASGSNCPGYYGLCADTVTYKVDSTGSNCPMCPDGTTYYTNASGTNCPQPTTSCLTSQYGCCPDGKTYKSDASGSNCMMYMLTNQLQMIETKLDNNCNFSQYGCCYDGYTKKTDPNGTNCQAIQPPSSYMPSTIYIPPPTGTTIGTTTGTTSGTTTGTTTGTTDISGSPTPSSPDSLTSMFGNFITDLDNKISGSSTFGTNSTSNLGSNLLSNTGSSISRTTSNVDSSTAGTTNNTGSSISGTTGNLTGYAKQPAFTPMYLNDSPQPTTCGTCPSCPEPQPCPPCGRCPEPNFKCEKVPSYDKLSKGYHPRALLNDFSQFSRFQ